MSVNKIIVSKESGQLQIPYAEYASLVEKVKEGQRLREVKNAVLSNLQGLLGGAADAVQVHAKISNARTDVPDMPTASKKVSVEFGAETPAIKPAVKAENSRALPDGMEVPPIKKDVSAHFNKMDDSGRLFSVFKQYYAFLNDSCGGTVRVTLKDGICSLWNYDEWEEFSYIDMFEGQLRIAVDQRYTDALQSLNLCEVPRLLSSRRNLVCVQVNDLNNTMLKVMTKAFEEVGLPAS